MGGVYKFTSSYRIRRLFIIYAAIKWRSKIQVQPWFSSLAEPRLFYSYLNYTLFNTTNGSDELLGYCIWWYLDLEFTGLSTYPNLISYHAI